MNFSAYQTTRSRTPNAPPLGSLVLVWTDHTAREVTIFVIDPEGIMRCWVKRPIRLIDDMVEDWGPRQLGRDALAAAVASATSAARADPVLMPFMYLGPDADPDRPSNWKDR